MLKTKSKKLGLCWKHLERMVPGPEGLICVRCVANRCAKRVLDAYEERVRSQIPSSGVQRD